MANISTENINTLAQLASSIGDGDYIYIYKGSSHSFARIERSVLLDGAGGGSADISELISNDWTDTSRAHVPSARQMNLMYNNLISVYNDLSALLTALANSAFSTAKPSLTELDWVGSSTSFIIVYSLTHCTKSQASPTSVAEGDSFTASLLPDPGYTLNGVTASGSGFTQSYDSTNDKINISATNVLSSITIGCEAVTFSVSVSYHLTGFSSESDTQITSAGSFVKVLSPNSGYVVKSIAVTMGGVDITSAVWTASTKTISIPLVTGNIVITATAEESTNHLVSLDLTGVSATSEIDLNDGVEDGGTLEVTLTKITSGEGSDVWPSSGLPTSRGFLARDVIVYMGDRVLEPKVDNELESGVDLDLTVTQVDSNTVRVKIDGDGTNANGVTGNVRIVNVIWKRQYIITAESAQTAGAVPGEPYSTNSYSAHTNTFIPLLGCKNLVVLGNNDTTPANYVWGCAIYDEQKVFVSGHTMSPTTSPVEVQVPPVDQSDQRNDGKYLRTSAWLTTSGVVSKIDDCYIFDATHGKFIWCGSNKVTSKDSIRSTYTQTQS